MRIFVVLFRAVFVLAVGMLAFIAFAVALIADTSKIPAQRRTSAQRRGNPTRMARNPREVGQSKIVLVEEVAS